MMKKTARTALLLLAALIILSCSLVDNISQAVSGSGGEAAGAVESLWPDVPQMHGLDKADFDIPFPIRLAIDAFISRFSESKGSMSFMAFSSSTRSVQEIMNYYNPDMMAQNGWSTPDQAGCTLADNQDTVQNAGGGCFYMKEGPDRMGSILAIVMGKAETINQVSVFFVRFDGVDFAEMEQQ
jgi:hypothetical protein